MTDVYRIAGRIIAITSLYEDVHILCRDYRSEKVPEFTVSTTQADIAYERERSAAQDRKQGVPLRKFPDGYLETLAVYRKIAVEMLERDTLLLHGSVVAVDGIGYLFTARSGTGKSTHTRLWRTYFGERAVMINDDKPLLQITEGGVLAHGTPWDGKHRLSCNACVPLRAVCILTRAAANRIECITRAEAYPMLVQQTYRPPDPAQTARVLALLDRLAASVNLFRLSCNQDIAAAETAYRGMKGD